MKPKFRSLIAAFAPLSRSSLIVCASLCAVANLNAADQTWTGAGADALWTTTGNWSGTATPGSGDLAIFDAASIARLATTLGADTSILGIKVVDPAGAVSIAVGNTLTIGASGIDMNVVGPPATSQNLTIAAPVSLGSAQSWSVASGRTLTVSGSISGSALTKAGAGAVTLSGTVTNTFAGPTLVTGGTLTFGSTSAATPGTGFDISNNSLVSIGFTTGANDDNIGTLTYSGTGGTLTSTVSNSRTITTGTVTVGSTATGIFNSGGGRCSINNSGTATGAGTFRVNIGTNVVAAPDTRHFLNGNWSDFTGTLELNGTVNGSTFGLRANNGNFNSDLSKATVVLSSSAGTFNASYISGTNGTVRIGALSGSASTNLLLGTGSGVGTFRIGEKNLDTTFDGTITNGATTANVDKYGSGVLTLTGTNTYTGTTTVTAGTLKYNGSKTGTGTTAVNTDGTLAGSGSLAGTTSVNTGGTLAPGDAGTGNLSFANLTLNTGSTLKLGATPSTNKAVIQAAGTLTLTTGVNVDVGGFGTDGTYDIIDITGANPPSGSVATAFTVVNPAGGKVYSFSNTATAVRMTIAGSDPSNFWNVDGGGSWATAANWTKNPEIPNAPGAIAKFGPGQGGVNTSFSGSFSVTLDDNKTVGLISFNDDFGAVITIDSGTPAGSLLMDNDGSPSSIVVVAGDHIVNAPVVMNSLGMGVDAGTPYSLTLNGVVSGIGAALSKSGTGKLTLTGDNTYNGGTIISGGVLNINSATSLGNVSGALRFSGGALELGAALSGITRSYQVSGISSAIIDTNGNDFGYDGVISPFSGGTGGLTKNGTGTLTLSAPQTYVGSTTVNAGIINLAPGSSISGTTLVFSGTGGNQFHVNGGTFNGTTSSVTGGSGGFLISSGSATFSGAFNVQDNATGVLAVIKSVGGTLNAASMSLGRSSSAALTEPAAGATNSGLVVDGISALVNISGNLAITGSNSTSNARIDNGTVTVGGTTTVGLNNTGRWSVLDVNGGTFNCANVATGVQLGNGQTGNAIMLVQDGGVANVGRITFNAAGAVAYTELVHMTGGSLYVGAGGMGRIGANALAVSNVRIAGGTLGASADWTSTIDTTLLGSTSVIKAANLTDEARNITLSGIIDGAGDLTKTGAGVLTLTGTNTYSGVTNVNAGSLNIQGDNSGATGSVNVLSGATLGGSGNIGGNVTIQSGGHQAIAVAATAGSQPLRTITGALTLSGGDIVDLTAAVTPAAGSYTLVTATGGISGTLATSTINYNGITGTLTIEGGNTLKLTVTGSGYASWASDPANGLTAGVNDGPNDDPDNDSIDNLLEFVLGGLPMVSSSDILPELDASGANFIFTFTRNDDSKAEVTLTFDHDTDLSGGWAYSVAIDEDGNPPTVTVNEGTPATDPDEITISIPKGGAPTIFGRLRAEIAP